jgi:hypothetical protein
MHVKKKSNKKYKNPNGYGRSKVVMIGVAYMGSWMAPFKFEILNIVTKAWS